MNPGRLNISNFEKITKNLRRLEGDGLVSNRVDFEMDAGPDQEPVQITNVFCDACRTWLQDIQCTLGTRLRCESFEFSRAF